MAIGAFARESGLTASALRFYADSGLLVPAEVDADTGYRYYGAGQVERAVALRRLREIAMPLADAAAVLDAEPAVAARLISAHAAEVLGGAAEVQEKAAEITASLGGAPGLPIAAVKGPVLADAVEQVLTATANEPGRPVLGGLRVEAGAGAVTLTATDRYRLATRTLVPAEAGAAEWAATIEGGAVRAALPEVRRSPMVRMEASLHGLRLRVAPDRAFHCRMLEAEFPDYRLMLASLPEPATRVSVPKDVLLRALEEHPEEHIALRASRAGLDAGPVGAPPADAAAGEAEPAAPRAAGALLAAAVTGAEVCVCFALTTLYPAVSTALGPDVLVDLRGPGQPATIRSADRGDLTTLAMPVKPGTRPAERG